VATDALLGNETGRKLMSFVEMGIASRLPNRAMRPMIGARSIGCRFMYGNGPSSMVSTQLAIWMDAGWVGHCPLLDSNLLHIRRF
jgi:hypothetical protein